MVSVGGDSGIGRAVSVANSFPSATNTKKPILFQGEGITDDILRKVFYSFCVVRFDPHLIMDAESRGIPPLHYHCYEGIIYLSFLFQHLEHMSTKKLGQWMETHPRHDKKIAALEEETVGRQGVKMRVKTGIVTECLYCYYDTWDTMFLSHANPKKLCQTLCRTLTEFAQQFSIIEEELSQDLRNGKNVLTKGDWIKNRFLEVMAELDHLLGMA